MRNKRRYCICLSGIVLLAVLSGCESTVQEPIVALKQKSEEKGNAVAATGLTIAEQVQAPERYQTDLTDENGMLNITVNAPVTIPDVEGIWIKGLKGRKFTEKERRSMEKLASKRGYDFYFENYQSENSPNVMAILTTASSAGTEEVAESSSWSIDESDYRQETKPSAKKSKKAADKLIAELGLEEFSLANARFLDSSMGPNYVLHYTRQIDGIPITYTTQVGGSVIQDEFTEWKPWKDEQLELIYNADGLWRMGWSNPYEISTVSEEAVFLLPFSEIRQIFESVMMTNYGENITYSDSYESYISSITIEVNSVCLGYMKVQEKGDKNGAKLIPVWDFFGTISCYDADAEGFVMTQVDPFYSLVTINAMDGSVIDRYLGY